MGYADEHIPYEKLANAEVAKVRAYTPDNWVDAAFWAWEQEQEDYRWVAVIETNTESVDEHAQDVADENLVKAREILADYNAGRRLDVIGDGWLIRFAAQIVGDRS